MTTAIISHVSLFQNVGQRSKWLQNRDMQYENRKVHFTRVIALGCCVDNYNEDCDHILWQLTDERQSVFTVEVWTRTTQLRSRHAPTTTRTLTTPLQPRPTPLPQLYRLPVQESPTSGHVTLWRHRWGTRETGGWRWDVTATRWTRWGEMMMWTWCGQGRPRDSLLTAWTQTVAVSICNCWFTSQHLAHSFVCLCILQWQVCDPSMLAAGPA